MKYSNWRQGKRDVRKIALPIVNAAAPGVGNIQELDDQRAIDSTAGTPADPPMVGLRVLTPGESAQVLAFGPEFAKSRGVENAKPGDPLYDYGIALKTIELACVDPDTCAPDRDPDPFFDGGIEQILRSVDLGQDGILYLSECQQNWQAQCAPQASALPEKDLKEAVDEIAGVGGLSFFEQCRPALRWSLVRSMACLLQTLWIFKSLSGSTSESDTPS